MCLPSHASFTLSYNIICSCVYNYVYVFRKITDESVRLEAMAKVKIATKISPKTAARLHHKRSQRVEISKIFWGSMPPDLPRWAVDILQYTVKGLAGKVLVVLLLSCTKSKSIDVYSIFLQCTCPCMQHKSFPFA